MLNKQLLTWSLETYEHLPWRQTRSLYRTLVSEIMLQQTTVSTVLARFEPFIEKFPTLEDLAKASEKEVCSAWEGLGYYRRARNLRKAAIYLMEHHSGEFPKSAQKLKKIPGIGDYTANALLAIGMNEEGLGIDANLERVIARYFYIQEEKGPKLQKKIKELYEQKSVLKNLNRVGYRAGHEALMDLGRVFCQAKRADCHICPVKTRCQSRIEAGSPLAIPVVSNKQLEKKKQKDELQLLRVVVRRGQKVVGHERSKGQWLEGQVEIPSFILSSTDKKLDQYPRLHNFDLNEHDVSIIKTGITKYKIKNCVIEMSKKDFDDLLKSHKIDQNYSYYHAGETHFSSASKKALG